MRRTCAEAGPSTKGSSGPQVTVHHSSPNQLEEQVEGLLELVIKPCLPDRRVHGPRHWRMIMGFQQKTVSEATVTRYRGVDPDEIHVKKKKLIS